MFPMGAPAAEPVELLWLSFALIVSYLIIKDVFTSNLKHCVNLQYSHCILLSFQPNKNIVPCSEMLSTSGVSYQK